MRADNKKSKKNKKKNRIPLLLLVLVLLIGAAGVAYVLISGNNPLTAAVDNRPINPLTGLRVSELPDRVIQVSIDNVECRPQSGLSKADLVYEFPVEGGLTRLEAIFYGELPDAVGPIRSARPYFIDLAREYNAIFVHHGGSQVAFEYIATGVVDTVSPNTNAAIFYREPTRSAPHDSMIHFGDLWDVIGDRELDSPQETRSFTFLPEKQKDNNEDDEGTVPATTTISVDNPYTLVEYKFNSETGLYDHYVDGELYTDAENQEPVTASNILVQYVTSSVLDNHGRLAIDMTAGGEALLFTGGDVVKGTWTRADLDSPTVFTDLEGNDFVLSRGKTWVHIIDQNSEVNY